MHCLLVKEGLLFMSLCCGGLGSGTGKECWGTLLEWARDATDGHAPDSRMIVPVCLYSPSIEVLHVSLVYEINESRCNHAVFFHAFCMAAAFPSQQHCSLFLCQPLQFKGSVIPETNFDSTSSVHWRWFNITTLAVEKLLHSLNSYVLV